MSTAAAVEEEEGFPQCIVCYSDLNHPCVTPCGHNEICATCHLRLRHLHNDKKCPMCKQENQQLIVDTFGEVKSFEEYPLWGNELGTDFTYRDDVGMFFPVGYYNSSILPLFGHYCGVCNEYDGITPEVNVYQEAENKKNPNANKNNNNKGGITPMRGLQDHLRNKHRLTLCQLCAEFKRDFISRLPRFSPSQLKNHLAKGDGAETGFNGHPVCEFCRPKRFYDLTQLYMHLQKDHYKCHVCEKQGLANQYFRDYKAMEKHFHRQHFLCKDVQCIAARFMVFENEIDLRAHDLSVHGGTSTGSTKIQLEFRVRREGYDGAGYENQTAPSEEDFQYGLDGQAFVPESLPNQDGPNEETSHPQHYQRTAELRAQAAEIRANQNLGEAQEEAFPSLGGANSGIRMGWTSSGSLQKITKKKIANSAEQFPSLPAASAGRQKYNSVGAKLRSGGVSGSRQFSVMRSAAMGSAPAPSGTNWSGPPGVSQPASSGGGSFIAPSSFGPAVNRQSDLGSNNFPALGGASKTRVAYPVNSYNSNRAAQAPAMSSNNFPSLGGATRQQPHQIPKRQQQEPAFNNASHFPPPPTASKNQNSVRAKLLGNRKSAPTNSTANFPSIGGQQALQHGQATVEDMKASLGPAKYKELKSLTKDFASDGLGPQAYVDHAAALFDGGYGDEDFWNFVPPLLMSCPNQASSASAVRYMVNLRAAACTRATPAPSTSWSATPALAASSNRSTTANPYGAAVSRAPRAGVRAIGQATQPVTTRVGVNGAPGKHKGVWAGSSGASTTLRAKAAPGSVAVAAANQGSQTGTATKLMAKEKKQHDQSQQSNGSGKSKKKKKEKDELRALAFGK